MHPHIPAAALPSYRGYDVLAKRDTPSWNDATRRAIDARLQVAATAPRHLDAAQFATLGAVCARIVPQRQGDAGGVPTAALIDARLASDEGDGFRDARLPSLRAAWRIGLAALDTMARHAHARPFAALDAHAADAAARRAARPHRRAERGRVGRHGSAHVLREACWSTSAARITAIRSRGTRSASAAREPARLRADGFQPARSVGSAGGRGGRAR
jgi:antitoxin (DNA-binding transcriptional repressor) of toxin-antitoxin stability system